VEKWRGLLANLSIILSITPISPISLVRFWTNTYLQIMLSPLVRSWTNYRLILSPLPNLKNNTQEYTGDANILWNLYLLFHYRSVQVPLYSLNPSGVYLVWAHNYLRVMFPNKKLLNYLGLGFPRGPRSPSELSRKQKSYPATSRTDWRG